MQEFSPLLKPLPLRLPGGCAAERHTAAAADASCPQSDSGSMMEPTHTAAKCGPALSWRRAVLDQVRAQSAGRQLSSDWAGSQRPWLSSRQIVGASLASRQQTQPSTAVTALMQPCGRCSTQPSIKPDPVCQHRSATSFASSLASRHADMHSMQWPACADGGPLRLHLQRGIDAGVLGRVSKDLQVEGADDTLKVLTVAYHSTPAACYDVRLKHSICRRHTVHKMADSKTPAWFNVWSMLSTS